MRYLPFFLVLLTACQSPSLIDQIDALATRYPEATVAIVIDDAASGFHYAREEHRLFHAASTMKIPVMIEVFRQAEMGRFGLDDSLEVVNRFSSIVDGSPYAIEDDSDDAIYQQLGTKMSIRQLTYNMITVSSNLATNLLIDYVSADTVQATVERLGSRHMKVLRGVEDIKAFELGMSNQATAHDLALQLSALAAGTAVSPGSDAEMLDILADQQFNEMIPAGIPDAARIPHKTGWITRIHHDAALVYPQNQRPYTLVILTEGIENHDESASLGAEIASLAHQAVLQARNGG